MEGRGAFFLLVSAAAVAINISAFVGLGRAESAREACMKWQDLEVRHIRRAVEIFLQHGYEEAALPPPLPKGFESCTSVDQILKEFFVDEREDDRGRTMARYTWRLGNSNYPHMKLVVQEYLFRGEFFFGVDSHDEIDVRPDFPDYEAWTKLKEYNRDLRESIETHWREEKLPTMSDLPRVVRTAQSERGRRSSCGQTILVVDDEQWIIDGVEELLSLEGYQIERACNGREALEMASRLHPDLILMDYEMPQLDGIRACAALKDGCETRHIPVLLATACSTDLSRIGKADGFLVKPYEHETLVQFVRLHLG